MSAYAHLVASVSSNVYSDVHKTCLTYTPAHAWCSQTGGNACILSPKMHMHSCMRAYAMVKKLLCRKSYCELVLSLARASCSLSFAARSCCPSCCLDQTRHPTLFAQVIRPNPRQLMMRSPLQCRTNILQSSALVQASSSLSMGRTRAWPWSLPITEIYFRHFSRQL